MLDETVYRCISASCARSLPRRVNFCPYCGTAQHAGATEAARRPLREAVPPAVALQKAAAPAPPAQHAAAASAPIATEWGGSPRAAGDAPAAARPTGAGAAAASPPPPAAPRAPAPARPPERAPVRLRWWLVALAALWLVWIRERPATKRIDARIDHAIALATECKAREAQSELIALRSTSATPEQLLRVQQALNEAAATCSRSRQRSRAWRGAGAEVEAPAAASSFEKARRLLAGFARRWDEDAGASRAR